MFLKRIGTLFKKKPKYAQDYSDPYSMQSNPYMDEYFSGMEEIESMWSVMYNLKIVHGEKADIFEQKCFQNINVFNHLSPDFTKSIKSVPAYIRLTMLYEKQERYDEAITVCAEAIKRGYVIDNSKGGMYGRLSRLIRKSGKPADEDILKLIQQK